MKLLLPRFQIHTEFPRQHQIAVHGIEHRADTKAQTNPLKCTY
jgi:hypothetical protein